MMHWTDHPLAGWVIGLAVIVWLAWGVSIWR